MTDDFFAPAAFKPSEALVALRRQLRELRVLNERGSAERTCFEWKGMQALELSVEGEAINVRCVERPMRSPRWKVKTLHSSEDVRRFVDELKRQLKHWDDED